MSSRAQLFIGRLPIDVRERDVESVFEKYGRLLRCDVKYGMYGSTGRRGAGRTGMAYAFVDYDDRRDAEDAIKYENGREMRGQSIVVEWARGPSYRSGGGGGYQRNSNYRAPYYRNQRDNYGRSSGSRQNSEECYRCRRTGHWARDCPESSSSSYPRSSRHRSRTRSRSRSRRHRSVSGSRSRSHDRARRSPSDYRQKSRSESREKRTKPRSPSQSVSRSRSRSVEEGRRKTEKSKKGSQHSPSKSASRSRSPSKSVSRSPNYARKGGKSPEKGSDNYDYDDKHADDRGSERDRSMSHSPRKSRSPSKENDERYADDSDRSVSRSKSR